MPIQMTRGLRDDTLDALIAALGPLDPASVYIGVAKAFTDNGLDTKITDFTEGTGAKFARQKVTAWGAPHDLIGGARAVDSPLLTFAPSAAGDAMEVVAWFAADALVAGNPLIWGTIVPPVLLASTSESMAVVARFKIDPNGEFVGETIING